MHITEGIITGSSAIAYTGAGVALVGLGARRMKKFVDEAPANKPLLGMGAALIFFVSLIPIPAFTGTCSHPCGTPLIGILLGPLIGFALTGASLLMQAAFFAHGGFGTWGANVVALGFFGCFFGWGTFKLARRLGLPIWAAGCAAGLIGDVAVYAASGMILGTTLSLAPNPQYGLAGYLTAIYSAYLPTQLPIAIGEMVVTGLALNFAFRQRPEVLADLGVTRRFRAKLAKGVKILLLVGSLSVTGLLLVQAPAHAETPQPAFSGMDESVNEHLAEAAGRPARDPYINIEAMGDLWNMLLLSAGAACGFIVGRNWDFLWGKRNNVLGSAAECSADGHIK
jgi:cobalt/nickel transport system permease protein